MNLKSLSIALCLFTVLGLLSCTSPTTAPEAPTTEPKATQTWECPMKCDGKKFTKAGQCPVCEMDLVTVSEG